MALRVEFLTPTKMSLLDVTTMGDSSKRGDSTKIGTFDSGLKYAIALLLRNNCKIEIRTFNEDGPEDRFSFTTEKISCEQTRKEKEVIAVKSELHDKVVATGFALNLGFNWELWMAYRELYSNMLDEGGSFSLENVKTSVIVEYEEGSEFDLVVQNKGNYILDTEPLYTSQTFDVHENPSGHLKIYKQTILVHEDEDIPSRYIYNIHFGTLDERRVLLNVRSVEDDIRNIIADSSDDNLLSLFIQEKFEVKDKEFLSSSYWRSWVGAHLRSFVYDMYREKGSVETFPWILDIIKKSNDCILPGRKLSTINDHIWAYSKTVTVEVDAGEKEKTLKEEIEALYDIKIECEIHKASLKGARVVADKFNKKMLVDQEFDLERDFPKFLVQYYDLTANENIIDKLSKELANRLKKQ